MGITESDKIMSRLFTKEEKTNLTHFVEHSYNIWNDEQIVLFHDFLKAQFRKDWKLKRNMEREENQEK